MCSGHGTEADITQMKIESLSLKDSPRSLSSGRFSPTTKMTFRSLYTQPTPFRSLPNSPARHGTDTPTLMHFLWIQVRPCLPASPTEFGNVGLCRGLPLFDTTRSGGGGSRLHVSLGTPQRSIRRIANCTSRKSSVSSRCAGTSSRPHPHLTFLTQHPVLPRLCSNPGKRCKCRIVCR